MLVCPQCHFENPNNNKFCQSCGTSLTHKPCHQCGSSVPFGAENCTNCGAFIATVWWGIIVEQVTDKEQVVESLAVSPEISATKDIDLVDSTLLSHRKYLDPGRRYLLTSTDSSDLLTDLSQSASQFFQGRVIDCQPLQKSVLEDLLEQQAELLEDQKDYPNNTETEPSEWVHIGVPKLALPYLRIEEFSPTVPVIHDAWHEGNREVILLPDRSQWQLLSQLWTDKSLPTLQIVYYLNEMATLWPSLYKINCCQSLLIETNLRVDEDQTFGLQQLYLDPPNSELTLQDLVKLWQRMLEKSGNLQSTPLAELLHQLTNSEMTTIAEVRSQLQALADAQQVNSMSHPQENNPEPLLSNEEDKSEYETQEIKIDSIGSDEDDLSTAMLPMQLNSLTDAGYTDKGRQRHHNEDYFCMKTQIKKQQSNRGKKVQARGLYIVCDGMGGHAGGEIASALAVETLQRYFTTNWQDNFPDQETISQGVMLANQTIYKMNQEKRSSGSGRMGTTMVMALVQDTKVAIAHVGDSRIYQIRRKTGLEQLTIDHEVGQRAIQKGVAPEIAYSRPDAYQLTQALGPNDDQFIKPDIQFLELQEDTLLLLCSDGLSDNNLIENHWEIYLTPFLSSSANLERGLRKLIYFANQHNGHDNITGILLRVKVRPCVE